MTDTEELERLVASITPGSWRKYGKNTGKVISEGPEVGTVEICETGDFRDAELVPFNADRWNADADAIALVPDLLAEVIALRAEVERLAGALTSLVELNDEYSPFGGEIYQDRIDRAWDRGRQTLAAHTQRVNVKEGV